ncbi:MAG TPA: acetylornithine transaminase [Chthoniobacterales bacterium]
MDSSDAKQLFADFVVPNYGRYDVVLDRGEGTRVWDDAGKSYLDFGAGIAVSVLGHRHPRILEALSFQGARLIHTSNLYYTRPQGELARRLVELTRLPGKVFFANSGAEVNEALIKAARKFGNECIPKSGQAEPRYEILTFHRSFHGRTMAGISATAQEKVKVGFGPLLSGFRHLPYNDLGAVKDAISPQTVGILMEVVQGEGGIHVAAPEFLHGLRALCDEHDLLLMFDEIQCGLGRVGTWRAWEDLDPTVMPDAVSWAKGIGGGFPLGAAWFGQKSVQRREGGAIKFCDLLQPGTHGTTFGGTPLACAVSLAVLRAIEEEGLLAHVRRLGAEAVQKLQAVKGVKEVRGFGLMLGMELDERLAAATQGSGPTAALAVVTRLLQNGLMAVPAGPTVIRFLPPLNVRPEEVDEAVAILAATLQSF